MLYTKIPYLYMIYGIFAFLLIHVLLVIWGRFSDSWIESPVIIHWPPVDVQNIKCYSAVGNDALKSIEDPAFSPKTKSIFFHETSCRGGIDSRQACAVESAALVHPDWDVYLLFTSPVTEVMLKRSCLAKLLEYPNIKLARIHAYSYTRKTAVSRIVSEKLWKSKKAVQHCLDIMKMLTLSRFGGVSLDLDVLVTKPFNCLPSNWIAKESPYLLASGVMRFSKNAVGRNFTKKVLRQIASTYNVISWSYNGASAIERVLLRRCKEAMKRTGDCRGITIYGDELFYPIQMSNAHSLINEGTLPRVKGEPYTYCLWNLLTSALKVHQKSPFVELAKEVCPRIYEMYGDEFGV
ncbi:hypothetical protein PYW07_016882 [Mythimna separata]|uniref:Alpha 1,4-glycosyltransferase domain-containing protein n=1 Tax=Mythimna separata TaxID=271217 RepID=A0AAD8DY10_MYTSE|nr:hypothetical protein PYW07_016882 [Mythimna separata]